MNTVSCCCGDDDDGFGRFLKIHNDFKVMKCKEENSKSAVNLKFIKRICKTLDMSVCLSVCHTERLYFSLGLNY